MVGVAGDSIGCPSGVALCWREPRHMIQNHADRFIENHLKTPGATLTFRLRNWRRAIYFPFATRPMVTIRLLRRFGRLSLSAFCHDGLTFSAMRNQGRRVPGHKQGALVVSWSSPTDIQNRTPGRPPPIRDPVSPFGEPEIRSRDQFLPPSESPPATS